MNGDDFEFEEFHISESIGVTFHDLDFVVCVFQGCRRDAVKIISEDSRLKGCDGVGKPHQHFDPGGFRSFDPIG